MFFVFLCGTWDFFLAKLHLIFNEKYLAISSRKGKAGGYPVQASLNSMIAAQT